MGMVLEATGCPIGGQEVPGVVGYSATFRWLSVLMSKKKSRRSIRK